MLVGTVKAASMLGICCQRLRQLLKEQRIQGAKKVGRFWQIPLFGGMPKVKPGNRGPQGTWRKRLRQASTRIHINKQKLESNSKYKQQEPIIAIRNGDRVKYCHEVEITGACRLVYRPDKPLPCGAVLWIEVEANVEPIAKTFNSFLQYKPSSILT